MIAPFEFVSSEADLERFARKIFATLSKTPSFCVELNGELGAGKTTLVRILLRLFGLPPHIPVNSPTFAHVYEYKVGADTFAHIDLYRGALDTADMTFQDQTQYRGIFLEWPEASGGLPLKPNFSINIAIDSHKPGERTYVFGPKAPPTS